MTTWPTRPWSPTPRWPARGRRRATVWASTQTPFPARAEVARTLGLPEANVRVRPVFVGGGFGGKTRNQQVAEAARLSGRWPAVQVAWSRAEKFFYDSFRPARRW